MRVCKGDGNDVVGNGRGVVVGNGRGVVVVSA